MAFSFWMGLKAQITRLLKAQLFFGCVALLFSSVIAQAQTPELKNSYYQKVSKIGRAHV